MNPSNPLIPRILHQAWRFAAAAVVLLAFSFSATAGRAANKEDAQPDRFALADIFELEWASDPRVSADGLHVVYVRNFMDVMTDRRRAHLWLVDVEGGRHVPLTSGAASERSPRWSPDGKRVAYTSDAGGTRQVHLLWVESGRTLQVTDVRSAPGGIAWSPDGTQLAFTMKVKEKRPPFVSLPQPPEGADWAEPAVFIDKLRYRADGAGYLDDGWIHLFVVPAGGGTPRQLTRGAFDHRGTPSWTPDGRHLVVSANRQDDAELNPADTEIHAVALADGALTTLTDRRGPDVAPVVSPDGRKIAYLGFDDRRQGYQVTRLHLMDRDGGNARVLTGDLDRGAAAPTWAGNGEALYFRTDDQGNSKIMRVGLDGTLEVMAHDLGGTSLGRPYASGSFTVSPGGNFAFTLGTVDRPADVGAGNVWGGTGGGAAPVRRLTTLNEDLLGHKTLGTVEEIRFPSSHDQREIQGWVVKPPAFEEGRHYPLLLEIHGGPFANYGDRFAAEMQLFAAAGYLVLYINPRGSTSYGEEFGNLIHHNYPGEDYDDLMSGVDAVIEKGWADPDHLYVTGGSGGGVLTSWIVGKTDRFRAAVVAKPVINWTSFTLTADIPMLVTRNWFAAPPWEDPEPYYRRSPLSLVGNVTTPTMLLTGEEDYRTPIAESEQYYQALRMRQIDTALVRIPGASHGIAARPSHLVSKVAHILGWFEKYRQTAATTGDAAASPVESGGGDESAN